MSSPRRRPFPWVVVLLLVAMGVAKYVFHLPGGPTPKRDWESPRPAASPAVVPVPSQVPVLPRAEAKVEAPEAPSVPIDEEHVFLGQVNRRGKPVGFHSRPGGHDPETARVLGLLDGPNAAGVYTAKVEIHDPSSGRWLEKTSTFYPDRMQRAAVLQAILHAFESREGGGEMFRGPSGAGFVIEGYFQNGRINTAYPIYSRR